MVATGLRLRSQPSHSEEAKAHEDGANKLDNGHTEVTDTTLQTKGCARETLGEEVSSGGHVAGERAAADATHEGQSQEDTVGSGVVLNDIEPAQHGDHEEK